MTQRYEALSNFVRRKMRMSHIYQPVMLLELLQNRGVASTNAIARALLARDQAQIEYYEEITRDMVGRVLTKSRGLTDKVGRDYLLKGFDELTPSEVKDLVRLCTEKIEEYVAKRGKRIWSHRRKSAG